MLTKKQIYGMGEMIDHVITIHSCVVNADTGAERALIVGVGDMGAKRALI